MKQSRLIAKAPATDCHTKAIGTCYVGNCCRLEENTASVDPDGVRFGP